MRPDLASLALFVRIAETRSITKAAQAGHIALQMQGYASRWRNIRIRED